MRDNIDTVVLQTIGEFPGIPLVKLYKVMEEEHAFHKKKGINFAVRRLLKAGSVEREPGWGDRGGYGHFVKKPEHRRCGECSGRGYVVVSVNDAFAHGLPSETRTCEACKGARYVKKERGGG
jgi:hypothetical protein